MTMYESIFIRKSVRLYKMEAIDDCIMNNVLNFTKYIAKLYEHTIIQFKIVSQLKEDRVVGGLFSVKSPYYLIAQAAEENEEHLLDLGYAMGQIVLYLASKGIGSCFLSSPKLTMPLRYELKNHTFLVLAFGYGKDSIYRDSRKIKRLKEDQLTVYKKNADSRILPLIQAARYAPSSMNNQPWRFVLSDNKIHIFCKTDLFSPFFSDLKKIDIGIMLSYIFTSAEEQWMTITTKKMKSVEEQKRKNDYVISVLVNY